MFDGIFPLQSFFRQGGEAEGDALPIEILDADGISQDHMSIFFAKG